MAGPLSSFVKSFKYFPKELFRMNSGRVTKLRDQTAGRTKNFDIVSECGLVKPVGPYGPNGASIRPYTTGLYKDVKKFRGGGVIVYCLQKGTPVPDGLTLINDTKDHYLLGPAVEMAVDDLNARLTQFLESNSTIYTREQWLDIYRSSKESEAASPATTAEGRTGGEEEEEK